MAPTVLNEVTYKKNSLFGSLIQNQKILVRFFAICFKIISVLNMLLKVSKTSVYICHNLRHAVYPPLIVAMLFNTKLVIYWPKLVYLFAYLV